MRHVIAAGRRRPRRPRIRLRRRDHGRLRHQPARRADAADDRRRFPDDDDPEDPRRQRRAGAAGGAARSDERSRRGARPPARRSPPESLCAGGRPRRRVDLTPFAWTWSQVSLGDTLIRYGHPNEPVQASDAEAFALAAIGPGASRRTRLPRSATAAREDRAADAPCTVFLDFGCSSSSRRSRASRWRRIEPGSSGLRRPADADNDAPLVRDSHGREWVHRGLALESGGALRITRVRSTPGGRWR